MILLDTHAAIWFVAADPALGDRSRTMALQAMDEGRLAVSAVSFWEIAMLVAKGRLRPHRAAAEQRQTILSSGIIELPLTGDIGIMSVELDALHGDPADRFIAATAVAHGATLMTADDRLLRWRHPLPRQDASK